MNAQTLKYLKDRRSILGKAILYRILGAIIIVGVTTVFAQILWQNIYITIGLISTPILLFMLTINYDHDDLSLPEGYIVPETAELKAKFDSANSLLSSMLSILQISPEINLISYLHRGASWKDEKTHSIYAFQSGKKKYIVIPVIHLGVGLDRLKGIFAHEIGHLVESHGQTNIGLVSLMVTIYLYSVIAPVLLGLILNSWIVAVFMLILFNFFVQIQSAGIDKIQEYTADGFAVVAGFGDEILEEHLSGKPEPETGWILKFKRLTLPHPSDYDRVVSILNLKRKYDR